MRERGWVRYAFLLLALVFLGIGSHLQPTLTRLRGRYDLVSRPAREGVPPQYILASAVLGGFRGLFLTTLWVRAQDMKNDGKYYEMVDIYNIITKLEPNHHAAWAFQAWDLAYNVSVEHDTFEERVFWVFRGVDMLRRQGIPHNEHIPELCQELAWFFHHKIGQETDWAYPAYRAYLLRQVERVFQIEPENSQVFTGDKQKAYLAEMSVLPEAREALLKDPAFARVSTALADVGFDIFHDGRRLFSERDRPEAAKSILKDPKALDQVRRARLWTIANAIRQELSMNPAEMYRLADKFGPIDWRTPYAHSLYWSTQAFEKWLAGNPTTPTLKFERLVRSSLISLVKAGRVFQTEDGYPYYTPDLRLYDGAIRHIDETLEFFENFKKPDGTTVSLVGFKSGYKNFLKDAVFKLYFDSRLTQAQRVLKKFMEVSGTPDVKPPAVREFVRKNFAEWMDSPTWRDSASFLSSKLATAYFYLAVGDIRTFEYHDYWAKYFYTKYCQQRWNAKKKAPDDPDYRHTVPPLDVIRRDVILAILHGWDPRFRSSLLIRNLHARLMARNPGLLEAVKFQLQHLQRRQREKLPVPNESDR